MGGLQGSEEEIERQVRKLQLGESIMDTLAQESKALTRRLSAADRDRLNQYTTAVREAEEADLVSERVWECSAEDWVWVEDYTVLFCDDEGFFELWEEEEEYLFGQSEEEGVEGQKEPVRLGVQLPLSHPHSHEYPTAHSQPFPPPTLARFRQRQAPVPPTHYGI